MKTIRIREFQRNLYKSFNDLPVVITRRQIKKDADKTPRKTERLAIILPYDPKIEIDYDKIESYKSNSGNGFSKLMYQGKVVVADENPASATLTLPEDGEYKSVDWYGKTSITGKPIEPEPPKKKKRFGLF